MHNLLKRFSNLALDTGLAGGIGTIVNVCVKMCNARAIGGDL